MILNVSKVRVLVKVLVFVLFSSLIVLFLYRSHTTILSSFPIESHYKTAPLHEHTLPYSSAPKLPVKSTVRNEAQQDSEWIKDIQINLPNLPIKYWNEYKKKVRPINASCALFPDLLDLEYNNEYWQTLRTTNGTFQLLNAYLDLREGPWVRILGMLDRIEPTVTTHCQFWYADAKRKPQIVRSAEYQYMWVSSWGNYKQGPYQPYLISCRLPSKETPAAVGLVEEPCDTTTNLLKILYNPPAADGAKKDFAVCVKGLDFPRTDFSVRLAEWIELLHLLGAYKIFMYELDVHPNVTKTLNYYQAQGKIEVTKLRLAGSQPNAPALQHYYLKKRITTKRQNEIIPYNDCFYKHMYEYKYIVLLDTDEVIVPVEGTTWQDLLQKVLPKARKVHGRDGVAATYNVRNVYFLDDLSHDHGWFDDIPTYMHILQHVYRTKEFTRPGAYVKSFFDTNLVSVLHNHYPLACLRGKCRSYGIDTGDAQLQHYRTDCVSELKKTCKELRKESVLDEKVWRYKEPLIARVNKTLRDLGFLV